MNTTLNYPRRSGFAVSSLLLLTAVVAVYAAAVMSVQSMDPRPETEAIVGLAILGLVLGPGIGLFIALAQSTRRRDLAIGIVVGGLFGPPTVTILAIPDSLPVIMVGGVVLVGFALAIRLLNPPRDDAGTD
jgi:hypothetical protein